MYSQELSLQEKRDHQVLGLQRAETPSSESKMVFKEQSLHNLFRTQRLIELAEKWQGTPLVVLKGFSLMHDIYEVPGLRFASDIDLLLPKQELMMFSDFLAQEGFRRVNEKKWYGNRFKVTFTKTEICEIVIEVHTQLFWHSNSVEAYQATRHPLGKNLMQLTPEWTVLHLCYHYAFQHTCLKLYWLNDIYLMIQQKKFSIEELHTLSSKYHLIRAVKCSYAAVTTMHQYNMSSEEKEYFKANQIVKKLITVNFLKSPRSSFIRYYLVKIISKDNVLDTLKYGYYKLLSAISK